jgi:16S rRNA (uracil1498-N3)-methyltransferase
MREGAPAVVDTARAAAKQARRAWVPPVAATESTATVARMLTAASRALVLHEEASLRLTTVDVPDSGDLVLVVGPEGGITDDEIAAFVAAGAVMVRLGQTVLRTSTAGLAAVCALSARLSRW